MYPKIAQLKTLDAFRQRVVQLGIDLPMEQEMLSAAQGSPLAESFERGGFRVGNRWCIQPMEGWDAEFDGSPSEHTLHRWRKFGRSGAKLIWGGEAAAVRPDGRANPRQTLAVNSNRRGLERLREVLLEEHRGQFGGIDDLLIGLQLTHSGRFCRPTTAGPAPRIAYHHPLLDAKFSIDPADPSVVWTDAELDDLVGDYVEAARVAETAGYQFVDIKACHGYLLHEFLSARSRPGPYGGELTGRTRLLRSIIEAVRAASPALMIGVRLSVTDTLPYRSGRETGQPMDAGAAAYEFGFGLDPLQPDRPQLEEPFLVLGMLRDLGVAAVNVSAGSPYYNPHILRPAIFPPSDGYLPPEDPLVGVARHLELTRRCKKAVPDLPVVGSGYTYLQEYLPQVAQATVRQGWTDFVGMGRMVLTYWELPADVLAGRSIARKRLCRTFSDCTTGPRNGMISGCYPLDDYYKQLPEAARVQAIRQAMRGR